MRHALIGLFLMAATVVATPSTAAVNVSIGINIPTYPAMVRVPNYPVYYAPSMRANYFFYDGLYWVFANGTWYSSPWYNGPWYAVDPFDVPYFVLRVPVRYYSVQPTFFSGWAYDAPPRWGDYWGGSWSTRHSGWDRWSSAPAPAPLPLYQKSYSGSSYPSVQQQAVIQTRSYSYQPRETFSRQQFEQRRVQARTNTQEKVAVTPAKAGVQAAPDRVATQSKQTEKRQQQAQKQQARVEQKERAQPAKAQQPRQERVQPARAPQERAKPAPPQREERVEHAQGQQEKRETRAQQQKPQRVQQAERKEQRQERPQQREDRGQGKGKGHDRDNS